MWRTVFWVLIMLAVSSYSRDLHPQKGPTVRFVTVERGVRLEVVDWGGKGEPLIFLAGGFATAHAFDTFASAFTDTHHVLGITRRGTGASSHVRVGYDTATLTKDVLAVLDSLRLARVTLVSHSFGGSEATWLAAHYPARVERLIYLDSAFDLKRLYAWPGWWDSRPEPPKMTAQDSSSLGAYAAYVSKLLGATLPESDLAAKARFGPDGRLLEQDDYSDQIPRMRTGAKAAPFREVRAPALVIYAEPRSGAELFPFWDQLSGAEKEKGERYFRIWHHAMKWQWHHVAAELRGAQIVRLPAATHFVYRSRRFEVEHLMRAFLSGRSVFGGGKPPNKRMQLPTLQVQGT